MNALLLAVVVAVGLLVPVQGAMNIKIREHAGHPFAGTVVNFAVGLAALAAILALTWAAYGQRFDLPNLARAPWWAWLGGLVGVAFVTSAVLIVPRTGNAAFMVAVVFGQMAGAVALDHFGWLGNPHKPADWPRLLGVACMLLGVVLVVPKDNGKPAPAPSTEHAVER